MNNRVCNTSWSFNKKYNGKAVTDHISLFVKKGELFGLLGVNGARKTTLLKMSSCLVDPTGGHATLLGNDIRMNHEKVKEIIAVLPQEQ